MKCSLRTTLSVVAALAVACTWSWLALRVRVHERLELEHESEPRSLSQLMAAAGASALSAQLTRVELRQGEHVIFELCTKAQLEPSVWLNAFELALVELGSSPDLPLTVRVKLDAPRLETARRNTQGACVSLGGGEVARSGAYSVDAAWSEPQLDARILGAALAVRVLAYRPVQQAERTGWLLLAASVVSLLTTLLTGAAKIVS